MKLTKRLYTLSLTVTLFVTGFLLPGFSTSCTAQTETNSSPAYSCIDVQDNDGKNMAVPKYYFKALARKINEQFQTVAYKLDNISYSHRDYNVGILSVKELEEITGFTFFPDKPEITESIKSQKTSWK